MVNFAWLQIRSQGLRYFEHFFVQLNHQRLDLQTDFCLLRAVAHCDYGLLEILEVGNLVLQLGFHRLQLGEGFALAWMALRKLGFAGNLHILHELKFEI